MVADLSQADCPVRDAPLRLLSYRAGSRDVRTELARKASLNSAPIMVVYDPDAKLAFS